MLRPSLPAKVLQIHNIRKIVDKYRRRFSPQPKLFDPYSQVVKTLSQVEPLKFHEEVLKICLFLHFVSYKSINRCHISLIILRKNKSRVDRPELTFALAEVSNFVGITVKFILN